MTMLVFFYGLYSRRGVRSLMSGSIFKTGREEEKWLEELLGGKKSKKESERKRFRQVAQQKEEAKPGD